MHKRSRRTSSKSSRSHMREMQVDRAVADGEHHADLPRQRAFMFQRKCSANLLLRRGSAPTPGRVTRESELWNLDLTTKKKSLPIPRHTCPHHLSIPPVHHTVHTSAVEVSGYAQKWSWTDAPSRADPKAWHWTAVRRDWPSDTRLGLQMLL